MYLNGMGLRAVERITKVSDTTISNWVRQERENLSNAPELDTVPGVGEVDELLAFCRFKKKIRYGFGLSLTILKKEF